MAAAEGGDARYLRERTLRNVVLLVAAFFLVAGYPFWNVYTLLPAVLFYLLVAATAALAVLGLRAGLSAWGALALSFVPAVAVSPGNAVAGPPWNPATVYPALTLAGVMALLLFVPAASAVGLVVGYHLHRGTAVEPSRRTVLLAAAFALGLVVVQRLLLLENPAACLPPAVFPVDLCGGSTA